MKFLADESIDRQIVDRLRMDGHEVWYVAEKEPGISDDGVLDRANRENAVLLTADKDFGELVFRQKRISKNSRLIPGSLLVIIACQCVFRLVLMARATFTPRIWLK